MPKSKSNANTEENNDFLSTFHTINDLLANSEKFSHLQNKLFDGLIPPPGFYARKIVPTKILINNNCDECLNEEIYSKLLDIASINSDKSDKKDKDKNVKKVSRKKKGGSSNRKSKKMV